MTSKSHQNPDAEPADSRKPRKTFDVLRFCDCGRHGGLHGIALGCPGMADEIPQFIPGVSPGTIRGSYDPDFVPQQPSSQGRVRDFPMTNDGTGSPLTARVIASYDRELVHTGRKPQTLKTYRKIWTQFARAFDPAHRPQPYPRLPRELQLPQWAAPA